MARPKEYDVALRDRLLDRTAAVVATGGVDAFSLRALAASADTSTNAIYTLFGSRAGLVRAVVEEASASFTAAQRTVLPSADAVEDLRQLGRAYRAWALDHPSLYAVMFGDHLGTSGHPDQDDGGPDEGLLHGDLDKAMEPLLEHIARGMSLGVLRAGEQTVVATTIWAGVHGFVSLEISRWSHLGRAERDARYDEHLCATMSYWLSAPSG